MDRNAFSRLCFLLENAGGLVRTRNVQFTEQVAIFLTVLAHHEKHRVVQFHFKRSGYTISKHFNVVLEALLRLHSVLLVNPEPIQEGSTNERWKWFKGCLGALDGTYIDVRVPVGDKGRYRNRKGKITVNVLGVCDPSMKFVYLLSGWEGSAADSRILRDAVTRPNGFKVPIGNYYLCDCGYTNGAGFLAPYRGSRYHLDEWDVGSSAPQNYRELFNLRHAKARNVIERTFGLLKFRWGILRSTFYYPIKTQNRIIMACCLIHNFIRTVISVDPLEHLFLADVINHYGVEGLDEYIDVVETNQEWSDWRDHIAMSMYNDWTARR